MPLLLGSSASVEIDVNGMLRTKEERTYIIIPNDLIEYQTADMRSFFQIAIVWHGLTPILVQCDSTDEFAHDGELSPVNETLCVVVPIGLIGPQQVRSMPLPVIELSALRTWPS